ncbi:hypothetical protein VNO78_22786 [Psophocarpus tetragonolobus]|uniref:Uncharacterized protein n=1 Tax=Psophocarpus tetragonolobus TaxID=3891 RepID=A0AAN9XCR3_PSOTE
MLEISWDTFSTCTETKLGDTAENMGDIAGQLFRLLDEMEEPTETRPRRLPRRSPNHGAVARPRHTDPSFNNTGTQNMRGLINNTGYTKGNGNGSIVFGGFDSSTN